MLDLGFYLLREEKEKARNQVLWRTEEKKEEEEAAGTRAKEKPVESETLCL